MYFIINFWLVQEKKHIDINADLGEGFGQDRALMPYLSSCNIACGGHAGNKKSISNTLALAKENEVKIGAHPSFPDKAGFGRVVLDISDIDLKESLTKQISTFYDVVHQNNMEVNHVKAHGALYNEMVNNKRIASLFLEVLSQLGIEPKIYAPANAIIFSLVNDHSNIVAEAFIDRAYHTNLSLVSRTVPGSLHKSPEKAWSQLYNMVVSKTVNTYDGTSETITADTYCIHGDHPNALKILRHINKEMKNHCIYLR